MTPPEGALTPATPGYQLRLQVGDFVTQIAALRARIFVLEEELAALRAAHPGAPAEVPRDP